MALVLGNSFHRAQCRQTQQNHAPVLPCSGTRRDLGPRRSHTVKGNALWNVHQRERGRDSEPNAQWQGTHEEDSTQHGSSHSYFSHEVQPPHLHQQKPQSKESGIEGAWKQLLQQLQLPEGLNRRNTTIAGLRAQVRLMLIPLCNYCAGILLN
ncbi:hypothetical protein DUNSADRAFT_9221 [Dunaliella salina]|uniref:Encoded protein n=1 Tax=Dunaliella salina TaxID=3046 RepID=A0ABQ7GHV2_DUNSA|nr:hypothetical protein DUNSADRAFT_9221 [Dunaliella salina]|eukprot:KAF5834191.1 hypothetical protein DUNSADRAFT_9221 [Dunaliella salina]